MYKENRKKSRWLERQLKSGWHLYPFEFNYHLVQRDKKLLIPSYLVCRMIDKKILYDNGNEILLRSNMDLYSTMILRMKELKAFPIHIKNYSSTPKGRKILKRLQKYYGSFF